MQKFVIGALIALMGMSARTALAHGVQGAGQFFVNHADLASFYKEVPKDQNTHFLTIPAGQRFVLTTCVVGSVSSGHYIYVKENDLVKTALHVGYQIEMQVVPTADFGTGIPFEPGTSVYVESTGTERVTLIGYYADLP